MSATWTYSVFGLTIRSQFELPELPPAPAGRAVDVEICLGAIPPVPAGVPCIGPVFRTGPAEFVMQLPGAGNYRVRDGREITIDRETGVSEFCSDTYIRLFLLGSAFSILLHQRGLLPLHAAAVRIGDRAVLFAGASGAGKSTLAAHFRSLGHEILSEDVCVVSFGETGSPLAWPGIPRLKLTGEAVAALDMTGEKLERFHEGREKYQLAIAPVAGTFPLGAIYILDDTDATESSVISLTGAAALGAVRGNVFRPLIVDLMGTMQQHVGQIVRLLGTVPVFRAARRRGFDHLAQEAAALERHARGVMHD